jgi:PAS domain S-box-containing protein
MKAEHENLYESVGLKKDGTTFNIEAIGKTLPYKGQVVRVTAIRDITQRKQIEQALRESEERLRQVFTSISDHIYVTEFTETGQRINRYMSPTEALTGYPLERLLADWSFWPSKIIHPDDRELAANQVERFARGENSEVEYRLIRADGQVIWVRDSVRVEQAPASGSIIVYGVVSDITARKQAEEALRGTEHRLRTVINNTPLILFALDHEGIFTLSEGKGLDLMGLKPGEVVGRSIFEVYNNFPEMLGSVRQVLVQGEPHTRMIDMGSLTFEVWYEPLRDALGQMVGVVGVALDITERKEAEETIAQALERALEASRLKSQLLAKVSHELRTPLGAILGYTELIQSGEFGPISGQQARIVAKVMDSTHYLTKMVNELLDQAQLEVGKIRLNLSNFNLSELLAQVETKMSVLAHSKGLGLSTSIALDLPATLLGDQDRLQQILVNLASNAIKFTRKGSVLIRIYRPDATHWAIAVTDTGPGIPEEAQAYIFEPFQQVDGSITREHVGTGLGLSIVKQLVNLMEGQIILESVVGKGSTFTALLPLHTIEEKIHE